MGAHRGGTGGASQAASGARARPSKTAQAVLGDLPPSASLTAYDVALMAHEWEAEAWDVEHRVRRQPDLKSVDQRVLDMHGRILRLCANRLREAIRGRG